MTWGNPWHGKLAAGTIELVPGTPVTSITVDGVAHTVKSVSGNLGDTRYYKPPYLPDDPETPAQVAALGGKFTRDMVLFSDSFRYSPLAEKSVLANEYEWLLWDATALAWRKMKIAAAWQPLSSDQNAPSAEGANLVQIMIYRGDIFGRIDVTDTAPAAPSWTLISTSMLPYKYSPADVFYRFGAYSPANLDLKIDSRRDGQHIIVSIYGYRTWNPGGRSIYYSPPPGALIKDDAFCLQDAFEVAFDNVGATVSSISEIAATQIDVIPKPQNQLRTLSAGAPYYDSPSWYVPVEVEFKVDTGPHGLYDAALVCAAFDGGGAAHLVYLVATGQLVTTHVESADVYIGFNDGSSVPSYGVGPSAWTNESSWYGLHPRVPFSLNYTIGGDSAVHSRSFRLIDGGNTLQEWTTPFSSPVDFVQVTNNVVSLNVGGSSIARVGPGTVDATAMASPVYASFNHRTGAVYSSPNPIGVV